MFRTLLDLTEELDVTIDINICLFCFLCVCLHILFVIICMSLTTYLIHTTFINVNVSVFIKPLHAMNVGECSWFHALKRTLHWYFSFKYVVLVILMDQAPQIKTKFDINIVRNFILKMRLFWCDLC